MKISVIGLGLSYNDLTQSHISLIRKADVLAGGKRHLSYFSNFSGKTIEITKDLKEFCKIIKKLREDKKNIVVLASGDPLFYGIGNYLSRQLGKDNVNIIPNINSVSAAFSKINEPWHDAEVISLHGRNFEKKILDRFIDNNKLAVLTDANNSPTFIYNTLLNNNITDFNIYVFEHLGEKTESIKYFKSGESLRGDFLEPNVMIFLRKTQKNAKQTKKIYLGMPLNCFKHENEMITKPEIRVISLSKLMLEKNHIFWDLGAGSGSVSIEASYYIKTGQIYAVEKNINRIKDIEENKKQFNVSNLKIIQGILPEAIDSLPDPDRIFIGGGGPELKTIIKKASKRLLPEGIIVINAVLIKNMVHSMEILEELGFQTEMIQAQMNYGHKMPWNYRLKSQNPVWIIKAIMN